MGECFPVYSILGLQWLLNLIKIDDAHITKSLYVAQKGYNQTSWIPVDVEELFGKAIDHLSKVKKKDPVYTAYTHHSSCLFQ